MAHYQTIPFPDGTRQEGLFETDKWFQEIRQYISFQDKTILDIGCNEGSFCIQALQRGAQLVYGVDSNKEALKICDCYIRTHKPASAVWDWKLINQFVQSPFEIPPHDIAIFSMIIYWIPDAPKHIKRILKKTKEWSVFIFRPPTDDSSHYQPTIQELEKLVGLKLYVHSVLKHTNDEHIDLVIFKHA